MPMVIQVITLFHTSIFLKLVKPARNCFPYRKISSICMAQIALHCYSGFAFGQWNDALYFLLHSRLYTNCSSGSAYYSWKHIVHSHGVCEKICICVFKKMFLSWWTCCSKSHVLSLSSHKSYYVSLLGPSYLMSLNLQCCQAEDDYVLWQIVAGTEAWCLTFSCWETGCMQGKCLSSLFPMKLKVPTICRKGHTAVFFDMTNQSADAGI
jgi:hypothetical protein